MSEENKDEPKKLKGFANPELRKNINQKGRPKGAFQAAPKVNEIEDLIARGTLESIHLLLKMLRSDDTTESGKIKVATKFIDTHITVEKQGGKLRIEQENNKSGEKTTVEVSDVAGDNIVDFKQVISTKF